MDYRRITTNRQFKDATGHSKESFAQLLSDYESTYLSKNGQIYEIYIEENVTETPKLKTLAESLFFVLFQIKNDLIWGSLGCVFNMAGSTAHENFDRFSELLEQTLEKKSIAQTKF
ncbi:MAG: hypothetical protein AB8B69_22245 [Chitinophagales bacterium]